MQAVTTKITARINHVPINLGRAPAKDGNCCCTHVMKMRTTLTAHIKYTKTRSSQDSISAAGLSGESTLGPWASTSEGIAGAWHALASV